MNKKWIIIAGTILLLAAFLTWLFIESTKPLPGQKLLQDGREHKPEGSKLDYKFNPPTSGDHYPSWISKGFYEEPRPDGNLVHSLEHGYIIIWYNCEAKFPVSSFQFPVSNVYAQGINMTAGSEGSPSASLDSMPEAFRNGSCDSLKKELKDLYQKLGSHKLIVMPRVGMSSRLILTAWGRMEKLNSLDQSKIKEFIEAFRDNGPEQTNET